MELAPDPASQKAGRGLAQPGKWSLLGSDGQVLWGEIKGSGKNPYQARVDLEETAFKCSCPSRKFPCKHALGLMLILAEAPAAISASDPPPWVSDWLADRQIRAEKKAEKQSAPKKAPDPAAQEKRQAAREAKIADGIEALELWLRDVMRRGLAAVAREPYGYFDRMAARLVDAQAPGLARRVRLLAGIAGTGENSAADGPDGRLLAAVARLQLILQAYRSKTYLGPDLETDLRTAVGWTLSQDDLAGLPGQRDTWTVLAHNTLPGDDRIETRQTWLGGEECQRFALLLDFATPGRPFPPALPVGRRFPGELVFYPSASPLRAQIRSRQEEADPASTLPCCCSVPRGLELFAEYLALVPWIEDCPLALGDVKIALGPDHDLRALHAIDRDGHTLPLAETAASTQILALAAQGSIDLFGLWDGSRLHPLAVGSTGRIFAMASAGRSQLLRRAA